MLVKDYGSLFSKLFISIAIRSKDCMLVAEFQLGLRILIMKVTHYHHHHPEDSHIVGISIGIQEQAFWELPIGIAIV